MVEAHGQQDWISQVCEGVARLVDTAVRQWSGSVPPLPGIPLDRGGRYHYPPVTEKNVHEHIKQNPAADARHAHVPTNPASVSRAKAAFAAAQRAFMQAMQTQDPSMFAQAGSQISDFAKEAGVADPMNGAPPSEPDNHSVSVQLW